VDSHADLKWCPSPGCERAVNKFHREGKTLVGTCACGLKFCVHCMEEAHLTISCKVLKDWNMYLSGNLEGANLPQTKAAADIMTLQWIAENTKDCPKCGTTVEKNQGCFQMTCRTCHSQWCWRCLEDWSTHSDHFRCTKFDETDVKVLIFPTYQIRLANDCQDKPAFTNDELEKRKAKFKVAHFFNQFKDHDQSMKLEKQNRDKIDTLIKKLKAEMESVDGEYLEEAVVQLQEVRE
jgi:ariadne-1